MVARAFVDDISDDEVAPVGGQLGKRRDHAEVGIAFGQVEGAKLLLVGRQAVGIVGIVRLEEAEQTARLPGVHFLLEALVAEIVVAEDVDRPDLGKLAFVDFEHDIDAVLVELHDLGLDAGGKPTLAAVELENSLDVRTRRRTGEDLPRGKLDLRRDLVVLEALVALQDDAVDDRVFADRDDEVAGIAAGDGDVGEQLGRVQVLQRLVERDRGVGLAGGQIGVGANRLGLETLVALDRDRADRALGRSRGWRRSGGGRLRLLGRGGLREQRRGGTAEDRSHHQQRAGALKTLRT